MLNDIIITLDEDFSSYLSDIRGNENQRIENELKRIENERKRNEYFETLDKKMYCKKFTRTYGTIYDKEDTFDVPDEYTDFCMLEVYVNGFYLNSTEYIINRDDKTVTLRKPVDVIGTVVEIVVTKAVGLSTKDYNDLRWDLGGNNTGIDEVLSDSSLNPVQNQAITKKLNELNDEKVNKENGKGLSSNDFTDEDKQKLDSLDNYDDTEINEAIEILQNSGFITKLVDDLVNYYKRSETFTKEEVRSLINAISTMNIEKVESLPTSDISTTTIYLVSSEKSEDNNVYDEYVYINEQWEIIGSTKVDLTGYAKETWVLGHIADFLTETEVSNLISEALEDYYTKIEIDSKLEGITGVVDESQELIALRNQIPNGHAEGESITLTDSAEGLSVEKFEIYGNNYQEVREGYNLFNGALYNRSQNDAGNYSQASTLISTDNILLKAGTYTISYKQKVGMTMAISLNENSKPPFTRKYYYNKIADNKKVITITEDLYIIVTIFFSGNDVTADDIEELMIYEGSDEKTYEKYGKAPKVDEPSEIQTVNGENVITVKNKNLFDKKNYVAYPNVSKTGNTITSYSYEANKIVFNCNGVNQCRFGIVMNLFAENFTISWGDVKAYNNSGTVVATEIQRCGVKNNFTLENGLIKEDLGGMGTILNGKKNYIFESDGGEYVIGLLVWGDQIKKIEIADFQVEIGTEVTNYVEHKKEEYELNLGDTELLEGEYFHKINDKWYKHKIYEKIDSYTNEEITNEYISTTGELSEGATVYYKLVSEVDEEITDEDLLVQLEALDKAKTYKQITYIDSESKLKPILRLTYKKDLETVIFEENRKINARLDEIETLLSSTATSALLLDNIQTDLESEVM